jgi:hypothetical protein
VLSLRNAAIALIASAVIVGVLAGLTAAEFTAPSQEPPIGQPLQVDQQITAQRHSPLGPPVIAPQPNPMDPPVTAPQPKPADPPVAAPQSTPIHRDSVVNPIADRRAPVNAKPIPVASHPAPEPPAQHQPDSRPPSSALPAHNSKSRTMNTEPCACDGRMRQVHTHWDPPQG